MEGTPRNAPGFPPSARGLVEVLGRGGREGGDAVPGPQDLPGQEPGLWARPKIWALEGEQSKLSLSS